MKFTRLCLLVFLFLQPSFHLTAQSADSISVVKRVDSLLLVAKNLRAKREFQQMLETASAAGELAGKYFGKTSEKYAQCLLSQGQAYISLNQYAKTEPLYVEARDILSVKPGVLDTAYSKALAMLANFYHFTGQNEKAETYFLELKTVCEAAGGKQQPRYAGALNSLAKFYANTGRKGAAIPLYADAKAILEKLGDTGASYGGLLVNLGLAYKELGLYHQAEELYFQAMEILPKTVGKTSIGYGTLLNNLGGLYHTLRQYPKAEKYYLETVDVRAKTDGKKQVSYAVALLNLGLLYADQKRYGDAEPLFLEAKDICAASQGKESVAYGLSIGNLGDLYRDMGRYENAEPFYREGLAVLSKLGPDAATYYAQLLPSQAQLHVYRGEFGEAERLYVEALGAQEKMVGKDKLDYADQLLRLAEVYRQTGQWAQAQCCFLDASEIFLNNLSRAADYLSAQEIGQTLQRYQMHQDWIASVVHDHQAPAITRTAFDNVLFYKNRLVENALFVQKELANAPDSVRMLYAEWRNVHLNIADEYILLPAQRTRLTDLEAAARSLETRLDRSIAGFSLIRQKISWQDVRAQLKPGEAAIEFIQFQYYNRRATDSVFCGALVLRPQDTVPQYVFLGEARQIERLIAAGSPNGSAPGPNWNTLAGRDLYALIGRPLEKHLSGVKTVYYSPIGLLHHVPLAALSAGERSLLGDRFIWREVESTRKLPGKAPVSAIRSYYAQLYGGIQYGTDATFSVDPTGNSNVPWRSLSGARDEVVQLDRQLRRCGLKTHLLADSAAMEETVKALGRSAPGLGILHFATHSFYFPKPFDTTAKTGVPENVFSNNENHLFRAGLVLAGANNVWMQRPVPENREDGILTAFEITQMDLRNTRLVVLPPCESWKGDLSENEGLAVMQRAFKTAGAHNVLTSLWKVPDTETSEFMDQFYAAWLGGKPVNEAFEKARHKMRKKYPASTNWAAWVLLE